MLDLVYIIGPGSSCDDMELRYSIRSMAKHLRGFDRIVLVGHCPTFIKNVYYIPAADSYPTNPARNIYEKILKACADETVSRHFILVSDDYFLMRDFEASALPYYYCEDLADSINQASPLFSYRFHLEVTRSALLTKGLPTKNFNLHFPMIICKDLFPAVMAEYDWTGKVGFISKSLYANTLKIPGELHPDIKFKRPMTAAAIRHRTTNIPFFTTDHNSMNSEMKQFLSSLYPDASKWE